MAIPTVVIPIIESILGDILKKRSVDAPVTKAETVAEQVTTEIKKNPDIALVPVKSGWKSKINWFNGTIVAAALAYFGYNVPTTPEEWVTLVGALIVPVGNFILRQFFTKSVTASSVK